MMHLKLALIVIGFVLAVLSQVAAIGLALSKKKVDRNPLKWMAAMALADITLFLMGYSWGWIAHD